MTSLTLQDLRVCADMLHAGVNESSQMTQWDDDVLNDVIAKIDAIFESVQVVETLPGNIAALEFKK